MDLNVLLLSLWHEAMRKNKGSTLLAEYLKKTTVLGIGINTDGTHRIVRPFKN